MKSRHFLPATLFQTIFPILPIAPVNLSWNILLFLGTLCLFTLALEQDCFSLSSWKYISWTLMKSSTKGHTWENISAYAESRALTSSLSRVNCWVVIVCAHADVLFFYYGTPTVMCTSILRMYHSGCIFYVQLINGWVDAHSTA